MQSLTELLLSDLAVARGEGLPPETLPGLADVAEVPQALTSHRALPAVVDYRPNLRYVRWQGGDGCWGYSLLSVWDIINDRTCPYSPNLSLNLGLFIHRRRDLWENPPGSGIGVITSLDGRHHEIDINAGSGINNRLGCTTEGNEITNPTGRWIGSWTPEGLNEAGNYRLRSAIQKVKASEFSSKNFMALLANGRPIQVEIARHVVAIIGYDAGAKIFTFVDSAGDRAHVDGFGSYPFTSIDAGEHAGLKFGRAYVIDPIPPRPVPASRIRVVTPKAGGRRLNLNLWLSVEGSASPKRRIWPPPSSSDPSRILHYTVRLPSELIWPPRAGQRLILDVYDSAEFSETGGELEEFTAAFGKHVMPCPQLAGGPVPFGPRQHKRFTIP